MFIEKIDEEVKEVIFKTLENYINAWFFIPEDIEPDNLNIKRIRYVKEWGFEESPEDGFIVEFSTKENNYKELLGRSELGMNTPQLKEIIETQSKTWLLSAKDFLSTQEWYKYAVIYGELDNLFDNQKDYKENGDYSGENYLEFEKRYRNVKKIKD